MTTTVTKIALTGDQRAHIALLVIALRSGRFHQVRQTLHTPKGFCCLGVACEVFRQATGKGEWVPEPKDARDAMSFVSPLAYGGVMSALPPEVKDWYGFTNPNPHLDGGCVSAITMNDEEGKNFLEIADAFERTYLQETGHAAA